MPTYKKLVRDNIPQIIENSGKTCTTRTLAEQEYIDALKEKLKEETNELMRAWSRQETVEEAADILEVLHALAAANETSIEEIEKARQQKKEACGGYAQRIFLLDVSE